MSRCDGAFFAAARERGEGRGAAPVSGCEQGQSRPGPRRRDLEEARGGTDDLKKVKSNIDDTRNAVEFAKAIDAGHLHHVISIATASMHEGVFREDMFYAAECVDHPSFMTKHESEKIVRKQSKVPWTTYRSALVDGNSHTGEMDEIDGPYQFSS